MLPLGTLSKSGQNWLSHKIIFLELETENKVIFGSQDSRISELVGGGVWFIKKRGV